MLRPLGLGVTHGTELMKFAESIATGNGKHLSSARRALFEAAGERVLVDAAAVAANFQRMVRIADAMGIPVDDMAREGECTDSRRAQPQPICQRPEFPDTVRPQANGYI